MSWRFPATATLVLALALAIGWYVGLRRNAAGVPDRARPASGALLFRMHCASCHGPEGHGDGPSATPSGPPRDFTLRPWRFEPTAAAIRRVIRTGIPQTAMPGYSSILTDAEIEALVELVQRLAEPRGVAASRTSSTLRAAWFTELHPVAPPPLMVTDAAGTRLDLATLRGRLVLIHFWGTGCSHCLQELPVVAALPRTCGDRLTVLHVCADTDDAAEAQRLLDQIVPGAHAWADPHGLALARYEVHTLPTTWLIDGDGRAIARGIGARDWTSAAVQTALRTHLPPSR